MARSSRRKSNFTFTPLSKFLLLALLVVGVSGFLTVRQSGVLGTKDSATSNICKPPRVTKLNLSNPCDPATRDGFRKVEYKCSNNKTGTIEKSCVSVGEALVLAKKACSAGYKCVKPSPTPTKSVSPTPTASAPTPTMTITPTNEPPTPTPTATN